MNMKQKISELGLPDNQFIVVGSGIMAAVGIRDSDDIDMIVSEELFRQLEDSGWEHDEWADQVVLKRDVFDIGTQWDGKAIDELIDTATRIEGIPYLSLQDLRKWKKEKGRDKDIRDIKLIDAYLEAQS